MSSKWFLALVCTLRFGALSWSQDLGRWTDSYVGGLALPNTFGGLLWSNETDRCSSLLLELYFLSPLTQFTGAEIDLKRTETDDSG